MIKKALILAIFAAACVAKADSVVAPEFQVEAYKAFAEALVSKHRIPLVSTVTSISSKDSNQFQFTYKIYDNGEKCFRDFGTVDFQKKGKAEVTFYRTEPQKIDCN